jgi:hypothetical protein
LRKLVFWNSKTKMILFTDPISILLFDKFSILHFITSVTQVSEAGHHLELLNCIRWRHHPIISSYGIRWWGRTARICKGTSHEGIRALGFKRRRWYRILGLRRCYWWGRCGNCRRCGSNCRRWCSCRWGWSRDDWRACSYTWGWRSSYWFIGRTWWLRGI